MLRYPDRPLPFAKPKDVEEDDTAVLLRKRIAKPRAGESGRFNYTSLKVQPLLSKCSVRYSIVTRAAT